MNKVAKVKHTIKPMSPAQINKVDRLTEEVLKHPQIDFPTENILHGGMYSRSIKVKSGTIMTGALIKIPTFLIIQGDVLVYLGEETVKFEGYNVLPGFANRKQAIVALTDLNVTMICVSDAKNLEEAESAITDEVDKLASRKSKLNYTLIVG